MKLRMPWSADKTHYTTAQYVAVFDDDLRDEIAQVTAEHPTPGFTIVDSAREVQWVRDEVQRHSAALNEFTADVFDPAIAHRDEERRRDILDQAQRLRHDLLHELKATEAVRARLSARIELVREHVAELQADGQAWRAVLSGHEADFSPKNTGTRSGQLPSPRTLPAVEPLCKSAQAASPQALPPVPDDLAELTDVPDSWEA